MTYTKIDDNRLANQLAGHNWTAPFFVQLFLFVLLRTCVSTHNILDEKIIYGH